MTALDKTTPSVTDPTGEVPYSFIDIVSAGWNIVTDVEVEDGAIPRSFVLHQNYPNPFNPATTIRYELPGTALVKLKIYDVLGREVATILKEEQDAGIKEVRWDAAQLSSGIYFCRIDAGTFSAVKKMLLMK